MTLVQFCLHSLLHHFIYSQKAWSVSSLLIIPRSNIVTSFPSVFTSTPRFLNPLLDLPVCGLCMYTVVSCTWKRSTVIEDFLKYVCLNFSLSYLPFIGCSSPLQWLKYFVHNAILQVFSSKVMLLGEWNTWLQWSINSALGLKVKKWFLTITWHHGMIASIQRTNRFRSKIVLYWTHSLDVNIQNFFY